MLEQGKTRTAEIYKMVIKKAFKQALVEGYINKDMTTGLEKIKNDAEEKRILTEEKIWISKADLNKKERMKIYTHLDKQKMGCSFDKINSFFNENQSKISQNKNDEMLKLA